MTGSKPDSINNFQDNIEVVKVDYEGIVLFQKTINSYTGRFFAIPRSVNSTSDSGFIFSGITDYPHVAQLRENAFALKSDSNCNAPKFVNVNESSVSIPEVFTLHQNYPNPFNPSTNLEFGISKLGFVSLKVYDVLGNEVATLVNETKPAGFYSVVFSGEAFASGIYYYRMKTGSYVETKKMLLVK